MPYLEESLEKFNNLPPEILGILSHDFVARDLGELGKKYAANFYALYVSICAGDVSEENVSPYLAREHSLEEPVLALATDEFRTWLKKITDRINFLNADPYKKINIVEDRKMIIEILSENLVAELHDDEYVAEAVNERFFKALSHDLSFKTDMERALYQNQERFTDKRFVLDEKEAEPTIANWLAYFIKLKTASMPDNMVLSDFVSKSENAKRLDEKEKRLLFKLLLVYRNIKFFPESMPSDDGEGWEIIPVEREEEAGVAQQIAMQPKPSSHEALIDELKGDINNYPEGSLEREILEEESEKDREYHKLLLLAKKYPEGSLERRAVEEEIKKFGR